MLVPSGGGVNADVWVVGSGVNVVRWHLLAVWANAVIVAIMVAGGR